MNCRKAILLAGLCAALSGAAADQRSSLTEQDIEFREAKLTLESVTEENASLRERLMLSQTQIQALTDSLARSNSEAEVFRRQAVDLKLKMEALGLEGVSTDRSKLEQRLLKALSDLKVTSDEKDRLSETVVRLCEVLVRFLKVAVTSDGEARMAIENEMRRASQVLGAVPEQVVEAAAQPSTLTDAMVMSVKDELALVVANLGSQQGVKIGMPFQVWRSDKLVGEVRVVDVRDKISGAVIQYLSSKKDKIQVGDQLRVDARQ